MIRDDSFAIIRSCDETELKFDPNDCQAVLRCVEEDELSDFFYTKGRGESAPNNYNYKRSTDETVLTSSGNGYCIRTGKKISFNPGTLICNEAYQVWVQYGDEDYQENYCHFSGELSNGDTSMGRPILRKNWKRANAAYKI